MIVGILLGLYSFVQAKEVRSIHQFYPEEKAYFDNRMEGIWIIPMGDTLTFSRAGDNFYLQKYTAFFN